MSEETVRQIIKDSSSKSYSHDPLFTWRLKQCLDTHLPVITEIVNLSLLAATFPDNFKEAILTLLIQKVFMDPEILKNFHPISNLNFTSKTVEKVDAMYVRDYMTANGLHELLQSVYKKLHSTETVLLYVQGAPLRALDNHLAAVLVLLDLSAAFDTVDHDILISTLETHIGGVGKALDWFKSYLSSRH